MRRFSIEGGNNVKRINLAWFGRILQGTTACVRPSCKITVEDGRRRGCQRKNRLHNFKQWTGMTLRELIMAAFDRPLWKTANVASAFGSVLRLN